MNHADIISLWPTTTQFAAEVGVPRDRADKWKQRRYIRPIYWSRVMEAARKRGIYVSPEMLINAAERRVA